MGIEGALAGGIGLIGTAALEGEAIKTVDQLRRGKGKRKRRRKKKVEA